MHESPAAAAQTRISASAVGLSGAAVMLTLLYFWFGVADRYVVFLYGHVDRPGSPPALPFDALTRSRYWMSGLVAAGAVSLTYIVAMVVVGVIARQRGRTMVLAPWWRAWLWAAGPLALGIPLITMTQNQPTLPPELALAVTGAALGGLALALAPGGLAARAPRNLAWLGAYGLALLPTLVLWRAIELPTRGIMTPTGAWAVAIGSAAVGVVTLAVLRWLRRRRGYPPPDAGPVLAAGLWWLLLFAPLAHHVAFAPSAYRYITCAENVLGFSPATPLTALTLAAFLAWFAARP